MKTKNEKILYEIRDDNWNKIRIAYKLDKKFINKYKYKAKEDTEEVSESFFVELKKFKGLCNDLGLLPYDLLHNLSEKVQENIVPRGFLPENEELLSKEYQNIKWHMARADHIRTQFLEMRTELGFKDNKNIASLGLNVEEESKIRSFLQIDSEEYYNSETSAGSKHSKIVFLKERLAEMGCLVYETGRSKKIDENIICGLFSSYKQWPIIIINSKTKDWSRKIFTLIHELYHLLQEQTKMNTGLSIVSGTNEEYEADKFAARILFPEECYKDINNHVNPNNTKDFVLWLKKNKRKYGVSEQAQVFTLKQNNYVNNDAYNSWSKDYKIRVEAAKKKAKDKAKNGRGGSYHAPTECAKIIGPTFVKLVHDLYRVDKYSLSRSSSKLNVGQVYVEDVFEYWS